jgi:hypothetical protein
MFVFALSEGGFIEAANMPNRVLDTSRELPASVGKKFDTFYAAAIARAHSAAKSAVAVVEARQSFLNGQAASQAWRLSPEELAALGIDPKRNTAPLTLTRLHVRYDRSFAKDLVLEKRSDVAPHLSKFVVHEPFTGEASCPEADHYKVQVAEQRAKEIQTVKRLTGWSNDEIERLSR